MDNREKLIYIHGITASVILSTLPILSPTRSDGESLALPKTHPSLPLIVLGREYPVLRPLLFLKRQVSAKTMNSTEGVPLAVT